MMDYYGWGGYGYDWGFGLVDVLLHVLFLIFIIWAIITFVRMMGGRRGRHWMWHAHDALSILNERFAKGEIDKAEYEERKRALLGDR